MKPYQALGIMIAFSTAACSREPERSGHSGGGYDLKVILAQTSIPSGSTAVATKAPFIFGVQSPSDDILSDLTRQLADSAVVASDDGIVVESDIAVSAVVTTGSPYTHQLIVTPKTDLKEDCWYSLSIRGLGTLISFKDATGGFRNHQIDNDAFSTSFFTG